MIKHQQKLDASACETVNGRCVLDQGRAVRIPERTEMDLPLVVGREAGGVDDGRLNFFCGTPVYDIRYCFGANGDHNKVNLTRHGVYAWVDLETQGFLYLGVYRVNLARVMGLE